MIARCLKRVLFGDWRELGPFIIYLQKQFVKKSIDLIEWGSWRHWDWLRRNWLRLRKRGLLRGFFLNRSSSEIVIPLYIRASLDFAFFDNDFIDMLSFVAYQYAGRFVIIELLIICSWLGHLIFTSLANSSKRVIVIRTFSWGMKENNKFVIAIDETSDGANVPKMIDCMN